MYKIGEFSKLVDLPVRTLRYYDEIGILNPSYIDEFTGYRYYTEKNIIDCELIKLLKSLDFTLEEIVLYRDNLSDEIINKKKMEYERKMYLLELKYQRLSILESDLQNNRPILKSDEEIMKKILRRDDSEEFRRCA